MSLFLVICGFVLGMICLAGMVGAKLERDDRYLEEKLRPWLTRDDSTWGRG